MMTQSALWFRQATLFLCLFAVLLLSSTALAVGRINWKDTSIEERSESWKVDIEIYMPSPPDIAHVPMRFSFTPVVYYERTLVDGNDEPVLRKVPLEHRQPIVESVDVGFMDPGTGKIQSRTRFSFKVTRAHGFEAGEYQVKVTNSRNNQQIGTTQRLTFEGENEVIDRRSMVFGGEKKKKKDDAEEAEEEAEEEPPQRELTPDDPAFWEGGPDNDADGPPAIEEKPGGCGCRLSGSVPAHSGAAFGAAILLGFALRRRGYRPFCSTVSTRRRNPSANS